MKKLLYAVGIIAITLSLGACKTSTSDVQNDTASDTHNSQNSLDWAGLYKGITAVDGQEKAFVINIQNDLNYSMQTATVGKHEQIIESNGTFTWNKAGNEIILHDAATGKKTAFKVQENQLVEVDGKSILTLRKIEQGGITEKYWKLIEINGKPFTKDESINREPFITLTADNRLQGTGGCNSFNGTYEMGEAGRIKFSKVATTQMACMNMQVEAELYKVLEATDNYTISADGKHLSLNKARMAPLARFEVVYVR